MSMGWKIFVFVSVLASFVAHFVFLACTGRSKAEPAPGEPPGTTGHVWDEDLTEHNNPLPRWWLLLFHGTVVFSIVYVLLYPGTGIYEGLLDWSQESQYRERVAEADERFNSFYDSLGTTDVAALAGIPRAMDAAFNLYGNHCAQCHGSGARGAPGFPSLADSAWQWGGSPAAIEQSIRTGRQGVMPGWSAALGGAPGVERMANYVRRLGGLPHDEALAAEGEAQYPLYCAACHGPDGKGNATLGAHDLTDDAWVWGSSFESLRETIAEGRSNQMPAFGDTLGPERVRLLAAYVYSLSSGPSAASAAASTRPPASPPETVVARQQPGGAPQDAAR